MNYILMRKNQPITIIDFHEDGSINKVFYDGINKDIAPLQERSATNWISKWWKERSVPVSQGRVRDMLKEKGLVGPEEYLIQNLGLSLTDYYWIRPMNSSLTWEQVNLYDNDFKKEISITSDQIAADNDGKYSANSALSGLLEKWWMIMNGQRVLLKGNPNNLSAASINEVIATKIHELQGYDNYTTYHLVQIPDTDYDYGCYSQMFTSQQKEFISAHAVISSQKGRPDVSTYEQFVSVCGDYGIDKDQLRADLEYQILTDFVISNRDRHLNNVGVLRDADTLQFIRMAPIYDSGKSMCLDAAASTETENILNIKTDSFAKSELKLLDYVTDRNRVDISKLPGKEYIEYMYSLDSQMDESRIHKIAAVYEKKVDLLDQFQHGRRLGEIKRGIVVPESAQYIPFSARAEQAIKECERIKESHTPHAKDKDAPER